jgi:hypothetical protein
MPSKLVYVMLASAILLSRGDAGAQASSPKKLFTAASVATILAQPENLTGKPLGQSSGPYQSKKWNPTSAPIIQTTPTISPSSSRGRELDASG